jgi:hypothetical protein
VAVDSWQLSATGERIVLDSSRIWLYLVGVTGAWATEGTARCNVDKPVRHM